jgi:hypothetical protein
VVLSWSLLGCTNPSRQIRLVDLPNVPAGNEVRRLSGPISEVAPPAIFSDLARLLPDQQPQVTIAFPQPNQVIEDTQLEVKLSLQNFSIYKDETLELGPHVQLILDNQPARSVYSLEEAITLKDIAPGSHTLRAVAVQPWGESFKNEAAYAQTSFHVFAQTGENAPDPDLPLLTFIEPQGSFSAEPLLLDFYLTNAPLHFLAQESAEDDLSDWKIRAAVNGKSFVFDQWQPIYLKGFEPGRSWIQLTLIDEQGQPIENAFNSTIRVIDYDPKQQNSLAKLVRGELPPQQAGKIVDPNYQPPIEVPEEIVLPDEPDEIKGEELETDEIEVKVPETEASGNEDLETEATEAEVGQSEVQELETEELEIEDPEAEEFEIGDLESELSEPEAAELEPEASELPAESEPIVPTAKDFGSAGIEADKASEPIAEETEAAPKKKPLFSRFFGKKSPAQQSPTQATEPLVEPDSKEVVAPTLSEPVLLEPTLSEPEVSAPEVLEPEVSALEAPVDDGLTETNEDLLSPLEEAQPEVTDIDSYLEEKIEQAEGTARELDIPSELSSPAESEIELESDGIGGAAIGED